LLAQICHTGTEAGARGRIGSPGRVRLDPHADEGAALAAAKRLLRAKLRRGYQAVAA
jgi:predicted DNA-binding WGR domain protein